MEAQATVGTASGVLGTLGGLSAPPVDDIERLDGTGMAGGYAMKVLIACEFSGVVREAFRKRGHDAWSCDVLPPMDDSAYHFTGDIRRALDGHWDLMIAHPPCTWLCQAMRTNAARRDRPNITPVFEQERESAFEFVKFLYDAPVNKIAIENPIGYLNSNWRKPEQILRPFSFGHEYAKDVCLWLKNLPILFPTLIVPPPYKKLDFWSNKRNVNGYSRKSITFQGIADAMAEQWGTL